MVQLCNKGMKSHQSYTSAFLPIATFASVACMPRRQQPGNNSCNGTYMYVCISTIYFTMNMRRWWSYGGCSCA